FSLVERFLPGHPQKNTRKPIGKAIAEHEQWTVIQLAENSLGPILGCLERVEVFDDVAFGQSELQRRLVVAEALEDNGPARGELIGDLRFGRHVLRRVSDDLGALFHSLKAFFIQGALEEIVKGRADKKIQLRDFRK